MTTIATDGKTIAADSRGTAAEIIRCNTEEKLVRLSDGRIVGYSGTSHAARAYVAWLEAGGERPQITGNFSALVLHPDGSAEVHYSDDMPDRVDLPAVLGSGGSIALGAMLAGATPAEAVAIAAQRDPFTGGEVKTMARASALKIVGVEP